MSLIQNYGIYVVLVSIEKKENRSINSAVIPGETERGGSIVVCDIHSGPCPKLLLIVVVFFFFFPMSGVIFFSFFFLILFFRQCYYHSITCIRMHLFLRAFVIRSPSEKIKERKKTFFPANLKASSSVVRKTEKYIRIFFFLRERVIKHGTECTLASNVATLDTVFFLFCAVFLGLSQCCI